MTFYCDGVEQKLRWLHSVQSSPAFFLSVQPMIWKKQGQMNHSVIILNGRNKMLHRQTCICMDEWLYEGDYDVLQIMNMKFWIYSVLYLRRSSSWCRQTHGWRRWASCRRCSQRRTQSWSHRGRPTGRRRCSSGGRRSHPGFRENTSETNLRDRHS